MRKILLITILINDFFTMESSILQQSQCLMNTESLAQETQLNSLNGKQQEEITKNINLDFYINKYVPNMKGKNIDKSDYFSEDINLFIYIDYSIIHKPIYIIDGNIGQINCFQMLGLGEINYTKNKLSDIILEYSSNDVKILNDKIEILKSILKTTDQKEKIIVIKELIRESEEFIILMETNGIKKQTIESPINYDENPQYKDFLLVKIKKKIEEHLKIYMRNLQKFCPNDYPQTEEEKKELKKKKDETIKKFLRQDLCKKSSKILRQ